MNVNRTRGKVSREAESLDLDYSKVTDVIKDLQRLVDKYGPNIWIDKRYYEYETGSYYAVMYEDDETDNEMQRRIAREEKNEADRLERDRKEFERLKAKFGS